MKKFSAIIIGAGGRGTGYAEIMKTLPEKFQVVGVAEPIESRRNNIKKMYTLSDDACFFDYDEILSKPKMADIAVIATMDNMHLEPAMRAMELGYDLLLEKPAAATPEECIAIAKKAEELGRKVLVCHVLRYTPFYGKVKQLVMDNAIGDIMSVIAVEAVGNIHQSHSYVRGDWHKESETTPMLLAKCCHDLDIIQWILDKPCKKVSSFGDLTYFKPENAPNGAPKHCWGNECPAREDCPYSADKVYINKNVTWMKNTAARGYTKEFAPSIDELKTALDDPKNNFGSCVFYAGNDVVDHQIVNMEFEGGCTATLTMNAFNRGGRYIRLFGTEGELYANASDTKITVWNFVTEKLSHIPVVETDESIMGGHGGGDQGIISELYEYLIGEYKGYRAADIDISVKNHMIGFAAEEARHNNTVENIVDYCKRFNFKYK